MKKTIALLLTLLLCVCSLSALADDVRAVRPIRLRTDMNALAGLTLTAIPGAYDPKTNTLELTLLLTFAIINVFTVRATSVPIWLLPVTMLLDLAPIAFFLIRLFVGSKKYRI